MNLCKKKLKEYLRWVQDDCEWVAQSGLNEDNYHWHELRTLFRVCLMLGIFKNTFADINRQHHYLSELKNGRCTGNVYDRRDKIKAQLQEFLKPAVKKTLGVKDESEQKEN